MHIPLHEAQAINQYQLVCFWSEVPSPFGWQVLPFKAHQPRMSIQVLTSHD
jgi:hypothetical protein